MLVVLLLSSSTAFYLWSERDVPASPEVQAPMADSDARHVPQAKSPTPEALGMVQPAAADAGMMVAQTTAPPFGAADGGEASATTTPVMRTAPEVSFRGVGVIEGIVRFEGPLPQRKRLNRKADPYCAKVAMEEEALLVTDGGLANVYVHLVDDLRGKAPEEQVVIDQVDCMYRPRVAALVEGQLLLVRNSDGTLHNVHGYSDTKTLWNQAQPPKAHDLEKRPPFRTQLVKLKCDVHPWMTGYVHVSPHPFFAVTGEDGRFRIEGLRQGKYTLRAWHETLGEKTMTAVVGQEQQIVFKR
ncbi:MAG: carboxypeptidase regulatory-like domain-containing protein [Myxococcota bacterium]